MPEYKSVKHSTAFAFDRELNELAKQGWRVVSATLSYEGETNDSDQYYALLIQEDEVTIDDRLDDIQNKLESIEDNTDTSRRDVNLSDIQETMLEILKAVENLER